jgi:hypothetical protein
LVLYNVVDDSKEGICLADGDVRVNVYMPGRDKIVMKSNVSIDGGKVFKTKMDINPYRYIFGCGNVLDLNEVDCQKAMKGWVRLYAFDV